jgi:DNA polymerase-3 subunit delta
MSDEPIKPIYVLHGSDAFLRDEHRKRVVQRIIGDADPQTAMTSFDATAVLADVLDELRTLPFLAPRRAVLVSDADAFVSAYREQLEAYLKAPAGSSSLVLTVLSWPANTRIAKLVAKVGEVRDCSTPQGATLSTWIQKAAGKRGKKLSRPAADLLVQWRGEDLAALSSELEKLSLYVGDRRIISPDDVGALVTATAGPESFALTNAITAGDTAGALKALDESVTRRGEEFKVLGMLGWHLRRALSAGQQMAAGSRVDLRMPQRQKREFLQMLRRRPLSKLRRDQRRLLAADLAMKTGSSPMGTLQELVVALCN